MCVCARARMRDSHTFTLFYQQHIYFSMGSIYISHTFHLKKKQDLLLEMANLPFVTGKSLDPTGSMASNVWSAQNRYFRGLATS